MKVQQANQLCRERPRTLLSTTSALSQLRVRTLDRFAGQLTLASSLFSFDLVVEGSGFDIPEILTNEHHILPSLLWELVFACLRAVTMCRGWGLHRDTDDPYPRRLYMPTQCSCISSSGSRISVACGLRGQR